MEALFWKPYIMSPRSSLMAAVFAAAVLPLPISATDGTPSNFAKLVAEGKLAVNAAGLGRHMGESIQVELRDLSGAGLRTVLPAGWIFVSADTTLQDLMLVRAEPVALPPNGSLTVSCRAFCCEANMAGPGAGSIFLPGHQANEQLTALAEFVNANNFPDDAVLFAVWTVTGDRPISSIRADDMNAVDALRRKVSEITGQPLPWYTVSYDDTQDDVHFSNEAAHITGTIDFRLANNSTVTILAKDADGNTLTELGRDRALGPGRYSIEIDLTVKGWRRGQYSICTYADGANLVQRIPFEI